MPKNYKVVRVDMTVDSHMVVNYLVRRFFSSGANCRNEDS